MAFIEAAWRRVRLNKRAPFTPFTPFAPFEGGGYRREGKEGSEEREERGFGESAPLLSALQGRRLRTLRGRDREGEAMTRQAFVQGPSSDTELRMRLAIAHARFEYLARTRGPLAAAIAELERTLANATELLDRLQAVQRRMDARERRRRFGNPTPGCF